VVSEERPVFVRGLSRSGGTLLVTIVDSHPDVAMSYELYPNLLELPEPDAASLRDIVDQLEKVGPKRYRKVVDQPNFVTFLNRLPRGGIDKPQMIAVFREHLDAGMGVADVTERMELMARFARLKATTEGAAHWGLKCLNNYDEYLASFPGARFLNIVRDGRDVLASQLNEMAGAREVEKVAHGWVSTHERFRAMRDLGRAPAYEVRYEDLVARPRRVVKEMCRAIDLPYHRAMVNHHKAEHTVYGASHLSLEKIKRPINDSSIGRWRTELSPEQVDTFTSVAGPLMAEYGYTD